jgi:hypothetical protein
MLRLEFQQALEQAVEVLVGDFGFVELVVEPVVMLKLAAQAL